MASDSILEIRNLTKNYGRLRALNGLNLHVRQGEIYGLLGPNGSGKTTTLSIVMGILKETAGDCYWFDRKPGYRSRLRIGSLIEDPHFYPYLTLYDNLRIITWIKELPESQINYSLGMTGLLKRKYSRFRTLSSGLKQRLSIAAVLLGNPEVMVLDEPTKSLDPEGFSDLRDIIQKEAEKGKTIILSSHILDEVEKVCTHVGILKSGELVTQGKVEDILSGKEVVFISSEDTGKTARLLDQCPFIEKYEKQDSKEYKLLLNKKGSPAELNKYFFDQGIVLSKLVKQKNTLESEFLQLMK
ncbi:MAG: ATP-binding cassette domain-containing protein [Bacteroidales bacterium]|nr:ATP-binding cassette domain-containing protein [Bacteroidales bacterium]MBS3774445.1 ATP-binding cassette domain-containing protein [Bacteroidales bacterium]